MSMLNLNVSDDILKELVFSEMRIFPYYAPNFEEVEGAYWFDHVRMSVCPSVCLSVTLSCGHDIYLKTRLGHEAGI